MLPHSRGTAEIFFLNFSLCSTQLISLGPQQWKEIKLLWDGRGCCVHMCCERRQEGAGGSVTGMPPSSPMCPLPGEPLCQDGANRGWDEHPAPLCSIPLGGTDADSLTWGLQGTSAVPRGNQSSPRAHLNQSKSHTLCECGCTLPGQAVERGRSLSCD